MLELSANLWDVSAADARVITTNGSVKRNGACVMGRGCAREAKERFPGIDLILGKRVLERGNHVHVLTELPPPSLVSLPVKGDWWRQAELALIDQSLRELVSLTDSRRWKRVVLPRPGCGNGGLYWSEVRPMLAWMLDDRFVCVSK